MYIWRKYASADWLREHGDNLILRFGSALALTERPGKARTLVEISCRTRKQALQLQHELGGTIEKLRADWSKQLAKRTRPKPMRIGSRLTVNDPSLKRVPAIVIPAEAAFGTGEHATTAMCLRMLERVTRNWASGWSMLDPGTGSGILAIAASRFGAKRIVAIDNDPRACAIAKRNARANRVTGIRFRTVDVLNAKLKGKFDIITANLFSEILIAALPVWRRHLTRHGRMILSGVLRSQEKALHGALRRNGFKAHEIRRRGKWVALVAVTVSKRS